jgi:predicted Zn-dependent protease
VLGTLSGIFNCFFVAVLCLALARCATAPSPRPSHGPASQREEKVETRQEPNPRSVASLQLTEQARFLIQENKPDEALRVLERALALYPTNGRNYYYMAEAWLMKGNVSQATEFNSLAALYLRDEPEWTMRVKAQQERIRNR